MQRVLFVPRSALAAGALQNVMFELCEEVRTLMRIEGPGARIGTDELSRDDCVQV